MIPVTRDGLQFADFVAIEGCALQRALSPLVFVARGAPGPLRGLVHLVAGRHGLRLAASDFDNDLSTRCDVITGNGEFDIWVAGHLLSAIARVAGSAPVALCSDQTTTELAVLVDNGLAEYRLPDVTMMDPAAPDHPRGKLIERFTNGGLGESLRRCRAAIAEDENRYYLNGICWDQSGKDGRHFVATDGHRLLRHTYSTETGDGTRRIIPRRTAQLLCLHFSGEDATVYDASRHRLEIEIGAYRLRLKLIDGTYPDYRRVLPAPEQARHNIEIGRLDLDAAIARLGVVARRANPYGRCARFHEVDGRLAIETRNGDVGTALARTPAEWPADAPEIGLNPFYLSSLLATATGRVCISWSGPENPALVEDDDASMTRVIMPMRT